MNMAVSVGILIVSDRCSRGEAEDRTSPLIREWVSAELGGEVTKHAVIPDERDDIRDTIIAWSDDERWLD